jgi:hypothetical protein
LDLYFDKKTNLLAMVSWTCSSGVVVSTEVSDYKKTKGIMVGLKRKETLGPAKIEYELKNVRVEISADRK